MKYSNRAFIHKASTPDITIAAGKSIAIAYASQGDYRKAFGYIEWALNEARKQNAPTEYINDLGKLFKEYNEHNQANGSGN
jgi:replication-associated recombination protein RarA